MKIPKLLIRQPKKKLRASTARRSMAAADEMDYEEMSEPNMKLSRALLIVLVLHVVAVAGIIAFNTIKSRQGAFPPPPASTTATKTSQQRRRATERRAASARLGREFVSAAEARRASAGAPSPKALPARSRDNARQHCRSRSADDGKYLHRRERRQPVSIAKKLKVSQ